MAARDTEGSRAEETTTNSETKELWPGENRGGGKERSGRGGVMQRREVARLRAELKEEKAELAEMSESRRGQEAREQERS